MSEVDRPSLVFLELNSGSPSDWFSVLVCYLITYQLVSAALQYAVLAGSCVDMKLGLPLVFENYPEQNAHGRILQKTV
jgi:hypothetical protein